LAIAAQIKFIPSPNQSDPSQVMGEQPMANPPIPVKKDQEPVSGFLPREVFGDSQPKVGDSVTFEIKDVDPDSGECEVVLTAGEEKPEEGGAMDAMDNKFPEEGEEQ
jgi:hypothetical protein